jgi:aminoglycoside/choline kinase family phosphotransferase
MNRSADIDAFLQAAGWDMAQRAPLAGDAGNRKYERLIHPKKGPTILMDADPISGEDIQPFLNIAAHLKGCDLSAPEIYAANHSLGLILLEDFGDQLLFDVANTIPELEYPLYQLCLDALAQLHQKPPPPKVGSYFPQAMAQAAEITLQWYCSPDIAAAIATELRQHLDSLDWTHPVLVLRDYHAQNVVYRPEQSGLAQIGLLDFQDAELGHPLYDAASLIHDARRSLHPDVERRLKDKLDQTYAGSDDFHRALSTLSAQRNLRVLALFARLCLRDGKPGYLELMPHVWNNLWRDLSHPDLSNLFQLCQSLPEPTPELQSELRAKCASRPMS